MSWRVAESTDLTNILDYLDSVEAYAIQIYSYFIHKKSFKFPHKHEAIVLIDSRLDRVNGVIVISKRGIIYPRFETRDLVSKSDLIKIMANIQVTIHGVVGIKEDVDFFDSIIFRRIRKINRYIYYTLTHSLKRAPTPGNVIVAKESDHSSLLPLEIEYQREEVIVEDRDLNKRAVSEALKRKLIEDDLYYIKDKNLIVSKGGTTFRSKNFVLLGGIFTWKRLRNQGLSRKLLNGLISDQIKKGYTPALFVKDTNKPALHLYEKVGFEKKYLYQINYYKR